MKVVASSSYVPLSARARTRRERHRAPPLFLSKRQEVICVGNWRAKYVWGRVCRCVLLLSREM